MNNIIINIQPFVIDQEVLIYEDGDLKERLSIPLKEVPDMAGTISTQYNCKTINLVGNRRFLEKTKAQILSKFSEGLIVNIIER